jgi:protein-disulfide isomerase
MAIGAHRDLIQIRESDHILGAAEPELTLIEYGDFGCPFCFAASRPLASLLDRYPGLRLVWRHFPDPEMHPGADLAAELSEFAAASGKFWDAYALLLVGRARFSMDDLRSVAQGLDLDPDAAEAALRERRYRDRVMADVAGAEQAGVHATPTFYVGGERLEGSWARLAEIVPATLARSSGPDRPTAE